MTTTNNHRRRRAGHAVVISILALSGCTIGQPLIGAWPRPSPIVGEWVDVEKSSATDTALWVLRADGYDGTAHLLLATDSLGSLRVRREDRRYGAWYVDGALGDSTRQLCFSKRIGRFGATCTSFILDTVATGGMPALRLRLKDYRGQHHTRDRLLVSRTERTGP